jgi:hypothetical protein
MQKTEETVTIVSNDNSRNIITHHLESFRENDLDEVLSDYTNESILITQDATYRGPHEIRHFFKGLMFHFPIHLSNFNLDSIVVSEDLVFIVWTAVTPTLEIPLGTDTFIIKDGKIHRQTFAGTLVHKQ